MIGRTGSFKKLNIVLFMVLLCSGIMLSGKNVYAADTSWQDNFTYTLDTTNHYIKLTEYNGSATTLTVPAEATVDNVDYTTYLTGNIDWGASLTNLSFDSGIKLPGSLAGFFKNQNNLISLDLSGFDTSQVTDMNSMFYNCSSLTSLNLSGFNTTQVTRMHAMFYGCSSLTSLDLSGFNTSQVTNMDSMFYGCNGLTSLDVSGFNTSQVTSMRAMFWHCSDLTGLNVSGFTTSRVTDMGSMFNGCKNVTSLDISGFNTSQVTNMNSMFYGCSGLTSLNITNINTSQVTNMGSMFNLCSGLPSLDVSTLDVSQVTNMNSMFYNCSGLTSLDVSGFITSQVTDMGAVFCGCSGLTSLDVSGFNTSKVTIMNSLFNRCSGLESLDLSGFDVSQVTSMNSMFYKCTGLKTINAPKTLSINCDLPATFYDSSCRFYTSLPKNQSASLLLKKAPVDCSAATVYVADQPYTGKALEPEVTVALNNVSISDENYTLSYSDNTEIGTARVIVTFKGNYSGIVEKDFQITEAVKTVTIDSGQGDSQILESSKVQLHVENQEEYDEVKWETDDQSVATITNTGVLTFKNCEKTVTVIITLRKGSTIIIQKKKYFAAKAKIRSFGINYGKKTFKKKKSSTFSVGKITYGKGIKAPSYQWKSSNGSVATVKNSSKKTCTIYGKKKGKAKITVTVKNGNKSRKTKYFTVTVK